MVVPNGAIQSPDSGTDFAKECDNLSSLLLLRIETVEKDISSVVNLLFLMTATISKLEDWPGSLLSLYTVTFFAHNYPTAIAKYCLLENEGRMGVKFPRHALEKLSLPVIASTDSIILPCIEWERSLRTRIHDQWSLGDLNYQQAQNSRQLESNTSDRGRTPPIPAPSISLPVITDWIDYFPNPDFDMDRLANEWSEAQTLFSHDWGEMGTTYGDLIPCTAQAEVHSPSQLFWPVENLQSDTVFDERSFQGASSASWNYHTPVPITPSANSNQYNSNSESDKAIETSYATARSSPKSGYTCETCGMTYDKRHLLNDHKKIHEKSITCPVQRCSHRTAKSRDMERHVIAQHHDYVKAQALPIPTRPVCPVPGCKQGRRGFARKDHLQRHLKKFHPEWPR